MKFGYLIQKQTLELALASQERAYELQEEARSTLLGAGRRAIEEVFSSLATDEEMVCFDRIEIDVGVISTAALADELVERIRVRLHEALVREMPRPIQETIRSDGGVLQVQAAVLEALRQFLHTGQLPWWIAGASHADPEALLIEALNHSPQACIAMLRETEPEILCKRLARQFSLVALDRVLSGLASWSDEAIPNCLNDWMRMLETLAKTWTFIANPASVVLASAIVAVIGLPASTGAQGLESLLEAIFANLSTCCDLEPALLGDELQPASLLLLESRAVRHWLKSCDDSKLPFSPNARAEGSESSQTLTAQPRRLRDEASVRPTKSPRTAPLRGAEIPVEMGRTKPDGVHEFRRSRSNTNFCQHSRSAVQHETVAGASQATADERPLAQPYSQTSLVQVGESYFVENAGLILLWPFLRRFFETIGLIRDRRFISTAAQERGVLLLQYLSTGRADAPEHLVTLNKILCGRPLFEPVVRTMELTDLEVRESAALLSSTINHWKALKQTSGEGFRAAFLQREGRLARQENGWTLTVQRASYDVLLDRLQWGISLVVLPWMKETLFVEW